MMKTRSDRFAAAHEVSLEVLRRLEAMSDLAARLKAGSGDVDARAKVLAEEAEAVRQLVEHARDLQRAERGELAFEVAPCRLRELMAILQEDWKERIAGRGLDFSATYDGESDHAAVIDAARLRQLFDALLGRAVAETAGGEIRARLHVQQVRDGLMIEASVRDTGRALTAGQLAHIFDPAETERPQAEASLPTRIGMALANHLVTSMSGVLQAEANEDGGTNVTFSLLAPAAEMQQRRSPHVLIVDDNAINRIVAEALCEMFDCTSEQVRDGVEAVEAASTRAFDLILMDIKMPRMDGIAATRAIRALPGLAGQTPIVALTANAELSDQRLYLEAGMNEVVEKPIKPAQLAAVLELVPPRAEDGKVAAA